ncbi:hypothetical protein NQF86_06070 [Bombella sp. TMW 2.2543]|uniref:Uncharacterized protein n=1 Tax=Bombella pluederhausensis TaxID=2967336 RepID=A0ABT3WGJ8_9PROT|nr:hypothetical protein [Bombella pluederhausensis]MCX5618230.1 hypothetical protein [Bombella pluederhausensis]
MSISPVSAYALCISFAVMTPMHPHDSHRAEDMQPAWPFFKRLAAS